jgi:nucleoside-diphosphate-sugar epimerase
MQSVLLTGATGFIGSALKLKLNDLNFNVVEINSANGGITNSEIFNGLLSHDFTHVFHLAGKTFVPESWERPSLYIKVNVYGTQNVLEFCRKKGLSLTFVSAYLYGRPEILPIAEGSRIWPNNPYAHSKYLAEQLCEFYSKEFDLKVNIIRPFNAYGIGQDKRFLIPSIINQALNEDRIRLKDLAPRRDYVYLEDLVDGLICSLACKEKYSVYNMGSGDSISVKGVVDVVQEILGTKKPVISDGKPRKNEIDNVIADTTRANTELKWYPKYSFHDGIKEIIDHGLISASTRERAYA